MTDLYYTIYSYHISYCEQMKLEHNGMLCDTLGNSGFQVNWCHLGIRSI